MHVKCSTTLISEDSTDRELAPRWNNFPWDKARQYVNRLQTRIAKAVKEGKYRLARRLQYILTHSYYAKALAVKKVTENKGKRTAGVDGVRWKTPSERMRAVISLTEKGYQFVRRFDASTAALHDSQIDLSQKGETVYRDKGYFGTVPFASIDKTMKKGVRGKSISTKDERRNRAISRTRSLVERPFAVIKRVFHSGHVLVTTHIRVHAKNLFTCISYNLFNLVTVQKNCPNER